MLNWCAVAGVQGCGGKYVKKEFLCECFDFPIMEESMIFECGASVDFEA